MARYIYISMLILSRMIPLTNEETGWSYNQSMSQCFYMFESITIGGELAQPGENSDEGPGDVIGAFFNGECVGWTYVLESYTTLPLMGDDGSSFTDGYLGIGEVPDEILIYDVSTGLTFTLTTTIDFPGWANNDIKIISGESYVDVSYGCTDQGACNYDQSAGTDDGSCYYPVDLCTGCASSDGAGDGDNLGGQDCLGECGGSAELDECGICDGGGIPAGKCDCFGNVLDCAGQCGGSAQSDMCGECIDGSQLDSYECLQGCDGMWYNDGQEPTDAECSGCFDGYDICGVCGGDDSSCVGCTDPEADNYDESAIYSDGSCEYLSIGTDFLPGTISAASVYPNPFNPSATISFRLQSPSSVRIDIFNSRGRLVDSLYLGNMTTGSHQAIWDGSMFHSGLYVFMVRSEIGAAYVAGTMLK